MAILFTITKLPTILAKYGSSFVYLVTARHCGTKKGPIEIKS